MEPAQVTFFRSIAESTANELGAGLQATVPLVLRVAIFLVLAYLTIKVVLWFLRRVLSRVYDERETLVSELVVTVAGIFLWFGVALAVLSMLGLGAIAASLGTATGFIALGVSYALSDMIEDVVSGVYLLRDPDFEVGDYVETDKARGVVQAIELRKCRLEQDDGDVVVVANRDIESRWTKHSEPPGGEPETA